MRNFKYTIFVYREVEKSNLKSYIFEEKKMFQNKILKNFFGNF